MEGHQKETPAVNIESSSYKEVEWKTEHEDILVEWADKAMCYRWLHSKSHQNYKKVNAWFTIPVIIMSTITGTANFAQDRFPPDYKPLAQMGIGAVNIFAGILTTIQQFLKIGELNESHRVSSIAWDKFYRNIKVELAKSPEERIMVGQMLKMCKEEFDRLMETSPSINEKIIELFKKTFTEIPKKKLTTWGYLKKYTGLSNTEEREDRDQEKRANKEKVEKFLKIWKPEICDELVSTADARFNPDLHRKEEENTGPSLQEIELRKMRIMTNYENQYKSFITSFSDIHNRIPVKQELLDNMRDTMPEHILLGFYEKEANDNMV